MPLLQKIKIKYHNPALTPIEKIPQGDWIDLRAAETVHLLPMQSAKISLGVSMELPRGHEAHTRARSSTFKNWGIMLVNGMAVIDETYRGDDDIWFCEVVAFRETTINLNDRICQFRIVEKQPYIVFEAVDKLEGPNRGGHGSTGTT